MIHSLSQANRADIVTLDAGEVYSAVKQFGLVAVAKEIYNDGKFTRFTIENYFDLCLEFQSC